VLAHDPIYLIICDDDDGGCKLVEKLDVWPR
jgi:hypothetical protein